MMASEKGYAAVAGLLLEKGAQIDLSNNVSGAEGFRVSFFSFPYLNHEISF